ncbi:MAG: ABC transporter ATP-binding protein [Bacilli bacterium]|nr:ABC transporter ATP-binding protein/permease [Acholeplasmataceae bacterium]MDY2902557.1 ABC transporter ATP-binding protein [Bacilli bacterium]
MEDMEEYQEELQEEKFSAGVWKKILHKVFKRKKNIIIMIISVIILATLDIVTPIVNSKVIDVFFSENPQFEKTWLYIGIYILLALLYMGVIYTFINMAGIVEVEVADELRTEAFLKLQELPFSYYDKTAAGWIMARLTSDSRKLAEIISWGMVDFIWGIGTMTGILIVLYVIFWPLALIITILTPLLFLICMYFRKSILKAYRNVRKINSKITGAYNEGILGTKTTKTLVLEDTKAKEFKELCSDMKKNSIKAVIRSSIFWPLILVLGYVGVAITLRVGAGFVLGEFGTLTITVSVLYLFINYTTMFFDPIMQIARILAELQQAQASAERIISLIETEPEIQDTDEVVKKYGTITEPKRENWEPLVGDVDFNHVNFSYIPNEPVLKDFNLHIKAGTSVALVGATGSGKSTIVNLICRFYEPTSGEILIDGKNYKERSIGWLHENLGYVLQTPHLFNGTIMENIRYGRLDATDEECIAAAKAVSADGFINDFENKYETNVGEGGSKLSQGQRQLISFARALIANPRILILDEATSSIDTETEVLIQNVINKMLKGRTSFIVAHRLSTIQNADLILVIKDGEIIEQGNHKELLKLQKEYYNLYKNQFINEEMEKTKL